MTVAADLLVEHIRGDSLRTIARRHSIGHETARRWILRQRHDVLAAFQAALDAGQVPLIEVPFGTPLSDHTPDDHRAWISVMFWAAEQLPVTVECYPTPGGVSFVLRPEEP
jgi:hypothetical protein